MLVEGPPGPEGPAVSGTLSTPCTEGCAWLPGAGCTWRAQHAAVPGLYCFHMPRICTERFGVDFLVQK